MNKRLRLIFRFTLCLMAFTACLSTGPAQAEAPRFNLRFAVSDAIGLDRVVREWGPFAQTLRRLAGIELQFVPMKGRDDAFLSLRQKRADLVLAGPAEYVAIRRRTAALPVAGLARRNYISVIVGLQQGPAHCLEDLRGKTVAMGSVGSTSAHLAPMGMFARQGIDALREVHTIHADNLEAVLSSLESGRIAAVAMSYQHFTELCDMSPDPWKYRILGSRQILPGDVIMAGAHVSEAKLKVLQCSLLAHRPELIKAILSVPANAKYEGMRLDIAPPDSAFAPIRRMYAAAGFPGFTHRPYTPDGNATSSTYAEKTSAAPHRQQDQRSELQKWTLYNTPLSALNTNTVPASSAATATGLAMDRAKRTMVPSSFTANTPPWP
jgi:phosphonate transport system substrate-binding protein